MARPSAPVQLPQPFSESPLSTHKHRASPIEMTQQFARVDALHAQLKAETLRAQEFLLKLRRDEHDAAIQSSAKANGRTRYHDETAKHHKDLPNDPREGSRSEKKEAPILTSVKHAQDGSHTGNRGTSGAGGGTEGPKEASCKCHCSHHPWSPASEAVLRKAAEKYNPSLGLPTHVDEREVRDLEKRVRGLEGRVRGFEGLPPDREMALLEVERLRRELEGLARRREGLFEGLSAELVDNVSGKMAVKPAKGAAGKTVSNNQGSGKLNATGKIMGNGKK